MKHALKGNSRKGTRRNLKLETLERREVFAVGGLDPTFAFGFGKTIADFGGTEDFSKDSAFQSDGKIVVVGGTMAGGGDYNFALARYNSDGSLDASFGGLGGIGAGRMAADFASGMDIAEKVIIQPDGKILVIGWTNPFGNETGEFPGNLDTPVQERRWAIARFHTDGTLDNAFGTLGKVVVHRVGQYDYLNVTGAFVIGNKLLIVSGHSSEGVMTQLNLGDGSVDASFGNSGILEFNCPISIGGVAIHQGGIVVSGRTDTDNLAFARFHMDGTLDTNFGFNGVAVVGPSYHGFLNSVAVQSDGSIVGAGGAHALQGNDFRLVLARVLPNGTPDATFNIDGVCDVTLPASGIGQLTDVVLGPNGTLVASGFIQANNATDFAVVRVGTDGALDQNFGVDGIVKIDFGNSEDWATSVLTYANGKILVTGTANGNFAIARINGAGVLGNPPGLVRPDGLFLLEDRRERLPLRGEFLLGFVERIDQAIAQYRATNPLPPTVARPRASGPASRANSLSRVFPSGLVDGFFAELGDETMERGGTNANIANHPHQLSLRVSGSH